MVLLVTDVFVSYASEDREQAERLAHAFDQQGWSVWWDRKIVAGQEFDQAIEYELERAKSVVVLWSSRSIASEWVRNEAAVGAQRGVLVPAMIESVKLPLEFRRKQTADLNGWNGELSHSGFRSVCEGVASIIGRAPPQLPDRATPARGHRLRWSTAVIGVALLLCFGVYALGRWPTAGPMPKIQSGGSASTEPSAIPKLSDAVPGPADLVVGTYFGAVLSDSQGNSRSDIALTIVKLGRSTVRVTSDYPRLGTVEVALTQAGNQIVNADGDSPFVVDLDRNPPTLLFGPHGKLAYSGSRH